MPPGLLHDQMVLVAAAPPQTCRWEASEYRQTLQNELRGRVSCRAGTDPMPGHTLGRVVRFQDSGVMLRGCGEGGDGHERSQTHLTSAGLACESGQGPQG